MRKFILSLLLLFFAITLKPSPHAYPYPHLTTKALITGSAMILSGIAHTLHSYSKETEIEINIPKLLPDHNLPIINKIGFAQLLPTLSLVNSGIIQPMTQSKKLPTTASQQSQYLLWAATKCLAWYFGGNALDKTQEQTISIKVKAIQKK